MPENPLLPNRKLRELYTLMLRCRELDRRAPHTGAREALLAASTMHLVPGDILCAAPGDSTLAKLAPANRAGVVHGGLVTPPDFPFATKLTTAASMARGQLAASPADSLALTMAFSIAGAAEPGWQHALSVAQHVPLPLILIVADASGTRPSVSKTSLTWANLSALSRRINLPILSVDGEDAVAVYRCMQESVLHARAGGGPAVIWGVLSPGELPRTQRPLARLASYMGTRRIGLPK